MGYRLWVIGLAILLGIGAYAADSTKVEKKPIYGGMTLKFDVGAAVLTPALNKGRLQQYELAMNWQVINRLYPTLELGYAGGKATRGDSLSYNDFGGYFRAGLDINPLKKHPESPHAMLIGIRVGTDFQPKRIDCWGEIVAGCQVQLAQVGKTGFYMGWMGRLKILFTRKDGQTADEMAPIYIPGFGKRGNVAWGLSYHVGWKF